LFQDRFFSNIQRTVKNEGGERSGQELSETNRNQVETKGTGTNEQDWATGRTLQPGSFLFISPRVLHCFKKVKAGK
jgi:hypothetical protein